MYRDLTMKEISEQQIGQTLQVAGWVENIRDHGGVSFIDLRDMYGVLQVVIRKPELLKGITKEMCLSITGLMEHRDEETYNPKIPSGTIELEAHKIDVLGRVYKQLPFEIQTSKEIREDVRLKYRYLDLRRKVLQDNLIMRSKIAKVARDYYYENGFIEIETPMMIKSTPEGARDYLVPSRVHHGKFYALPQSPQMYKQLLMIAGFDRYIQLARCFRDEDLRADRQPEFTQIDLEMSFVDVEDILEMNEGFIQRLFKEVLDVDVELPLPRLTYKDAMERYGSDKPDTRFGMEICDISELVKNCGFGVFTSAIENGGSVRAIVAKDAAKTLTRKEIDKLTEYVKGIGAKGLAFVRLVDDEPTCAFAKFLGEGELDAILNKVGAQKGDVVLIVADKNKTSCTRRT